MNNLEMRNVLVVDDTAFMRKSLVDALIILGFSELNIIQAQDGSEGLKAIKKFHEDGIEFDVIFCDWNMPIVSGLQLLKSLRNSKLSYNKTPFILITTVSDKEKIIEALKYNINGYILKPFEEDKLKEVVENIG